MLTNAFKMTENDAQIPCYKIYSITAKFEWNKQEKALGRCLKKKVKETLCYTFSSHPWTGKYWDLKFKEFVWCLKLSKELLCSHFIESMSR